MPRIYERPNVCFFYGKFADCQNVNPMYCGMCKHWLCDTCRADYHRRIGGMTSELEKWVKGIFGPR